MSAFLVKTKTMTNFISIYYIANTLVLQTIISSRGDWSLVSCKDRYAWSTQPSQPALKLQKSVPILWYCWKILTMKLI